MTRPDWQARAVQNVREDFASDKISILQDVLDRVLGPPCAGDAGVDDGRFCVSFCLPLFFFFLPPSDGPASGSTLRCTSDLVVRFGQMLDLPAVPLVDGPAHPSANGPTVVLVHDRIDTGLAAVAETGVSASICLVSLRAPRSLQNGHRLLAAHGGIDEGDAIGAGDDAWTFR